MLVRKKGETHSQYCRRMESFIESELRLLNRALATANNINSAGNLTNPVTNRQYKLEAELMFQVMALAEHSIRSGQQEHTLTFLREGLDKMGFDLVRLYQDEALIPGAYNEKK
jgi:hypothetical protein